MTPTRAMTPTEVRMALHANRYKGVLPLFGKRPALKEWEKRIAANPQEIAAWGKHWTDAINTGILCRWAAPHPQGWIFGS